MPKDNIDVIAEIQQNVTINNISLRTWEIYFQFYLQSKQAMTLDLQNLIRLNKILSSAHVIGFKAPGDVVNFKLQREVLKTDLVEFQSWYNYTKAYDEKGILKPEFAMTKSEIKELILNHESEIIQKWSRK